MPLNDMTAMPLTAAQMVASNDYQLQLQDLDEQLSNKVSHDAHPSGLLCA